MLQRPFVALHGLPRAGPCGFVPKRRSNCGCFLHCLAQRQCPPGFVPQAPGGHCPRAKPALANSAMATTLYALKPRFQELLRPLVGRLAAAGVTANQVTMFALAMSVATGAFVALAAAAVWPFLLLPIVFLARMTLNAIDGMLAREFGQQSPLGAYLNELADVVSDAALYLPFALVAPFGPYSVGLVIVAACVSEMAGALGPMVGAVRRFDGPMGKSDRALVFGALGLYVGLGGTLPDVAFWLMPALALLDRLQRRPARTARRSGRAEGRAMNDRFTPPLDRSRRWNAHCRGAHVRHARQRRALLPPLAGDGAGVARRDRDVSPGSRALGPDGSSARRARSARLRFLRVGRARSRPLARGARPFAELRHVGARRADVHRPHRGAPRIRARVRSPSSPRAWAPCSSPPGRTTTRRTSAVSCSRRRRSG